MPLTIEQVSPADIWNNADNVQRFLMLAAFVPDEMTLGYLQDIACRTYNEQPTELKIAIHKVLLDERKKG
jgi:hypothetical protein